MRPACAPSGAGARPSTIGLASRKKSERIVLEYRVLVLGRERQRQELVDVPAEVTHTGTRPVGPPEDAGRDLREAGKVLQELAGRNAGDVEPHVLMTSQDEKR